jgi:hypothetical protein
LLTAAAINWCRGNRIVRRASDFRSLQALRRATEKRQMESGSGKFQLRGQTFKNLERSTGAKAKTIQKKLDRTGEGALVKFSISISIFKQ